MNYDIITPNKNILKRISSFRGEFSITHPELGVIGEFSLEKDSCYVSTIGVAHFSCFGINENLRGRGFGKKLIEVLCKDLADMGYNGVSLHCMASNSVALHIYTSNGFVKNNTGVFVKMFDKSNYTLEDLLTHYYSNWLNIKLSEPQKRIYLALRNGDRLVQRNGKWFWKNGMSGVRPEPVYNMLKKMLGKEIVTDLPKGMVEIIS